MSMIRAGGLLSVSVAMALLAFALEAAAQTTPGAGPAVPAPAAGGRGGGLAAVLIIVGVVVLIAAGAKLVDLKRKREGDAAQLQAQISDAFLREPGLASLPVTASGDVPLWSGSPATIRLSGVVPSEDLHQLALRLAQDEASRIRPDFQIEDRINVVPEMARRAG